MPACNHDVHKHFEGYQTLQYMAGGSVELFVGNRRYALQGQWFWSAYPGPAIRFHALPAGSTWDHRYVAFRGSMVGRWMAEGLFPIAPQRPPQGLEDGSRFDELLTLAARTDKWGQRRAAHVLEGLLITLAENRAQDSAAESWLERVFAVLDAAVAEQPHSPSTDYEALAAELRMSLTTLRRRFRKATGVSPHVYLLHSRVAVARRLLAETDLPLKAIAEQAGYGDVFFFSRQFRRFTGVAPGLYRRSCMG
ncbi:MAG: AraC family transcriptional regulator [Phycisphaerae bacterium]